MSKQFIVIILVFIAGFFGLLLQNRDGTPTEAGSVTNHTIGESELGINVTEYGDFQCSACFRYHPILQQLKEKYKDQVVFQFRHFPIVSSHPNAMVAHRAAEAASKQGKFWEMHDRLFESAYVFTGEQLVPTNWAASNNPSSEIETYAEELGLDMEQYRADVQASSTGADIQADIQAGNDARVTGTPTFLINGQRIDTPNSFEAFDQLIQDAIAEKSTG